MPAFLTNSALTGATSDYVYQPRHQGLKLVNFDHNLGIVATTTVTSLVPYVSKVFVPETLTITDVWSVVNATGAAALTAGSNRVGVYSSAGVLLSQSADITAWTANTAFSSPLGTPQTLTGGPGLFVWLARLTAAVTLPTHAAGRTVAGSVANLGLTPATARYGELPAVAAGSGLPASFTPSALTLSLMTLWAGAS